MTTRTTRTILVTGGLLALACLTAGLAFLFSVTGKPGETGTGRAEAATAAERSDRVKASPDRRSHPGVQAGAPADAIIRPPPAGASQERLVPREKAVAAWESLIDQVSGLKEAPADDQAQRVKAAFGRLAPADRMDGIRRALNLLPDEQFPALYAILFDRTQDAEVLDAIFDDALNRPESIKNPLMKALRQDDGHPLFFESARILDASGERDEQPAPAR